MPNKECELQPNKIVPLFYPTFFISNSETVFCPIHISFFMSMGLKEKNYPTIIPAMCTPLKYKQM